MSELAAAGLPEWTSPESAACADYGSQQRLQAFIVCSLLDLHFQIQRADRMTERQLQRQFDNLQKTGIILASLLKAGGA